MPSSISIAPAPQSTAFSLSYITIPDAPLWRDPFAGSFLVFAPRPKRRRRIAARTPVRPDPWLPMAGRLELVADTARQAARAARGRDPRAFDRLMNLVREALLDAIVEHNTNDIFADGVKP